VGTEKTTKIEKDGKNKSSERIECGLRLKRKRFFLWNSILNAREEKQIKENYDLEVKGVRNTPSMSYLLTYGDEPFLKSCQLCSHSQHLRNPKVHHSVHKSPPLVPILSQIDPVHTIPSYLFKIYLNIVHPPTSSSS
jgi:hypothetical protein